MREKCCEEYETKLSTSFKSTNQSKNQFKHKKAVYRAKTAKLVKCVATNLLDKRYKIKKVSHLAESEHK